MRLIDVLNKIADGELKEGTKVKVDDKTFVYGYQNHIKVFSNEIRNEYLDVLQCLAEEVELIEPDHSPDVGKMAESTEVKIIEPKCNHEWRLYTLGRLGGKLEYHKICKNCGIDEEIEPTDNTTEKIEELIAWYQLIDGTTDEEMIHIVWNKLNEVIRKINKEG